MQEGLKVEAVTERLWNLAISVTSATSCCRRMQGGSKSLAISERLHDGGAWVSRRMRLR
jgi:hypothetical protein